MGGADSAEHITADVASDDAPSAATCASAATWLAAGGPIRCTSSGGPSSTGRVVSKGGFARNGLGMDLGVPR